MSKKTKPDAQTNLKATQKLVEEAFLIDNPELRAVKLEKVERKLLELDLDESTRMWLQSCVNQSTDEAGYPLDSLKNRTFNRLLDHISDNNDDIEPRAIIGVYYSGDNKTYRLEAEAGQKLTLSPGPNKLAS